jgi:hypothetical protein
MLGVAPGEPVDLHDLMYRFTLDTFSRIGAQEPRAVSSAGSACHHTRVRPLFCPLVRRERERERGPPGAGALAQDARMSTHCGRSNISSFPQRPKKPPSSAPLQA